MAHSWQDCVEDFVKTGCLWEAMSQHQLIALLNLYNSNSLTERSRCMVTVPVIKFCSTSWCMTACVDGKFCNLPK